VERDLHHFKIPDEFTHFKDKEHNGEILKAILEELDIEADSG